MCAYTLRETAVFFFWNNGESGDVSQVLEGWKVSRYAFCIERKRLVNTQKCKCRGKAPFNKTAIDKAADHKVKFGSLKLWMQA